METRQNREGEPELMDEFCATSHREGGKGWGRIGNKGRWNEEDFEQTSKTCMNQREEKVMRLQKWTSGSASDYDIGGGSEADGVVRLRLSRAWQAPSRVRQAE